MCLSCVATNMWRGVTFVMTLMLTDLAKATIRIEKLAEKEKKEWMLNWQGNSRFKRNLHFHEWITINTTENQRKTPHEVFQANGSIKLCTNGVWTVIWFNIYGCTDDDFKHVPLPLSHLHLLHQGAQHHPTNTKQKIKEWCYLEKVW